MKMTFLRKWIPKEGFFGSPLTMVALSHHPQKQAPSKIESITFKLLNLYATLYKSLNFCSLNHEVLNTMEPSFLGSSLLILKSCIDRRKRVSEYQEDGADNEAIYLSCHHEWRRP